ncbi:hypothetical protein Q7P37_002434 [Cladosporium fusiforme]
MAHTAGSCVTQARLPASVPTVVKLDRIHRYLPSSPYTHAAIYTPISAPESHPSPDRKPPLISRTSEPPSNPLVPSDTLLLLKADFKWRLGFAQEQAASPPWIWKSEQLCGPPPYQTRDLERVQTASQPGIPSQYSAAYIIQINFCDHSDVQSGGVAVQFLQITAIRNVLGWLAEDWYDVRADGTSKTRHYSCMLSFDASTVLDDAQGIVRECLRIMTIHTPLLHWLVEAYKLDGSLTCSKAEPSESARFWNAGSLPLDKACGVGYKSAKPIKHQPAKLQTAKTQPVGSKRGRARLVIPNSILKIPIIRNLDSPVKMCKLEPDAEAYKTLQLPHYTSSPAMKRVKFESGA